MRVAFITNPAASSVSQRSRVVIRKALSDAHDLVIHETTRQGHATRLAHRAMREGCDVVVTLGGDGTVNEAANGLLGTDCPLAPLPGGSTNVFARAIGYPNDAVAATQVVLDALEKRSFKRASLGRANDRAFTFHVGIGFDAAVVTRVEQRSPLKRYAGHPWFIASAIRTWASSERRRLSFDVEAADGRVIHDASMAVAMNVNPYTFLGNRPLNLAPELTLNSRLSLIATTSLSALKLAPVATAAFSSNGEGLPNQGAFHHWSDLSDITITSELPVPYQLDGEPQDPVNQLHLEHLPDALTLVSPLEPLVSPLEPLVSPLESLVRPVEP